jgi:hypothetical protein
MEHGINFFAEDPGRYKRFAHAFRAQTILGDCINDLIDQHGDKLTVRGGEERDLSLLVIGVFFGKAQKTFQAVRYLCALGFGEDALILVRSNINLLINIGFILRDNDPIKRGQEFIAYSIQKRLKYLDSAHEGKRGDWMKHLNIDEITERAKKWESSIQTRAGRMPASASLLHYDQGYRFYSSLEHSDAMAISTYIQKGDAPRQLSISGPSDTFIGIALAHNFSAMADLCIAVMHYFDVPRPDLVEKLLTTWRAFDRESADGEEGGGAE